MNMNIMCQKKRIFYSHEHQMQRNKTFQKYIFQSFVSLHLVSMYN